MTGFNDKEGKVEVINGNDNANKSSNCGTEQVSLIVDPPVAGVIDGDDSLLD